jgi:hypothetical protein
MGTLAEVVNHAQGGDDKTTFVVDGHRRIFLSDVAIAAPSEKEGPMVCFCVL